MDQLQKKLKKYHDENKVLKEKLLDVDSTKQEVNQTTTKSKVVESNILKESMNKSSNFKNMLLEFTLNLRLIE